MPPLAAAYECLFCLINLIKQTPRIITQHFNGKTLLHHAASGYISEDVRGDTTNAMDLLLSNGADINATASKENFLGCTPLAFALLNDYVEGARWLLNRKATICESARLYARWHNIDLNNQSLPRSSSDKEEWINISPPSE